MKTSANILDFGKASTTTSIASWLLSGLKSRFKSSKLIWSISPYLPSAPKKSSPHSSLAMWRTLHPVSHSSQRLFLVKTSNLTWRIFPVSLIIFITSILKSLGLQVTGPIICSVWGLTNGNDFRKTKTFRLSMWILSLMRPKVYRHIPWVALSFHTLAIFNASSATLFASLSVELFCL